MQTTIELKLDLPSNFTNEEVQTLLAIKMYETERLSLGQAAKLAVYSKRAFIEILGRNNVPVFNYSPDELREELGKKISALEVEGIDLDISTKEIVETVREGRERL